VPFFCLIPIHFRPFYSFFGLFDFRGFLFRVGEPSFFAMSVFSAIYLCFWPFDFWRVFGIFYLLLLAVLIDVDFSFPFVRFSFGFLNVYFQLVLLLFFGIFEMRHFLFDLLVFSSIFETSVFSMFYHCFCPF